MSADSKTELKCFTYQFKARYAEWCYHSGWRQISLTGLGCLTSNKPFNFQHERPAITDTIEKAIQTDAKNKNDAHFYSKFEVVVLSIFNIQETPAEMLGDLEPNSLILNV